MKLQKDKEELQMLSKRSQSEKATYVIPTLIFWKRQKYGDSLKISDC